MERLQGIALGISDGLATIIDGLMCFPTPEEHSVVWPVGLGAAPIGVGVKGWLLYFISF